MKTLAPSSSPTVTRTLLLLLVVALAVLPAHFLHLRSLGLYEDDYWAIAPFLTAKYPALLEYAKYHFSIWMTGRPLNYVLPAVFSSVGSRLAGLDGIYLLTASGLLLNCLLIYWIARKFVSAPSAMFGAVFYGLFPADTTKILLVHGTHVQTSVTFCLIAFALFLTVKPVRWLGYPVAMLSLLSYESAYLPFILAPLLLFTPTRGWIKRGIVHLMLCAGTVAAIAAIRLSKGDSRAVSALHDVSQVLYRSFTSLFIGPKTSASLSFTAPVDSLAHFNATGATIAIVAAVGLIVFWLSATKGISPGNPRAEPPPRTLQPPILLVLSGLAFWSASYALSIVDPHYPPNQTVGRLTSVHVAAGLGAALVLAGACEWALRNIPRSLTLGLGCCLAGYMGLLANHDYVIQRGYVQAWKVERDFWGQVLALAPDLTADTAILVTGRQPPQSYIIASNSWSDALVLQNFFQLPPGIEPPVLVMLENSGPLIDIHASGGVIRWKPFYWSGVEKNLDPKNVIVLQSDGGKLTRIEHAFIPGINGYLQSKPVGAPTGWPHSFFYHQMFERTIQ